MKKGCTVLFWPNARSQDSATLMANSRLDSILELSKFLGRDTFDQASRCIGNRTGAIGKYWTSDALSNLKIWAAAFQLLQEAAELVPDDCDLVKVLW